MTVAARILVIATVVAATGLGLAVNAALPAGATDVPGCPYAPNIYAGGTDTVGQRWGGSGHITSYDIPAPTQNFYFSDQAIHGIASGNGLEVGWYVGWGAQTKTYVTKPHAYATANGPDEVDGPNIGASDNVYSTEWIGGGIEEYSVTHQGSYLFAGSITIGDNGPGTIVALGEVNASGLAMAGYFNGLHHYGQEGVSYDWPGLAPCNDSGYVVYNYGTRWLHDD